MTGMDLMPRYFFAEKLHGKSDHFPGVQRILCDMPTCVSIPSLWYHVGNFGRVFRLADGSGWNRHCSTVR